MRDKRIRRRLLAGAVVSLLLFEVIVLAWPEEKTENDGWFGRGTTSEIAGEIALEEHFTVTAANFRAIRFYPRKAGPVASGTVHLTLWEMGRDDRTLRDRREVPVAELLSGSYYDYRFSPIALSTNHVFLFQLSVPDAKPGEGIVVDIMHRQYRENPADELVFGGRGLWGSLRFTAEIDRPTMLARLAVYLQKGFFGRITLLTFAACWLGLHLLAMRVLGILLDDAYAPA